MNGLALCAGVGGLELALHLLSDLYRTVGYVERDAYAAAVLVARMEDASLDPAPIWDDVATFDGRIWRGAVDVITAGYPCQPFSVAGKKAGEDDARHLWPHIRRIIDEVSPEIVILENVAHHLKLGFDVVLAELRGMGYEVATGLFSAAEVGAPHERLRLFVVAIRTGGGLGDSGEPSELGGLALGSGEGVGNALGRRSAGEPRRGAGPEPQDGYGRLVNAEHLGLPGSVGRGEPRELAQERSHEGLGDTAGSRREGDALGGEGAGAGSRVEEREQESGRSGALADTSSGGAEGDEQELRQTYGRPLSRVFGEPERSGYRILADSEGEPRRLGAGREDEGEARQLERSSEGLPDTQLEPAGFNAEWRERVQAFCRDPIVGLDGLEWDVANERLFPPRPDDRAGWAELLESDPSVEPALRRDADGLAYRVDRLRCCGNGVHPIQAAVAIFSLWLELVG